MSFIAKRMDRIDASGIRKAFAMGANMENPINLSIGQPDYDVDEKVKQEAILKIQEGANAYTQTWGIDALREACSNFYDTEYGVPLDNVMITSGVSGGLFLALSCTLNDGDEVLFADPYFVMYKHLVNFLGGTSVPIDTYPNFKLSPESLTASITEKSKILIVNSPCNPTGVTLNADELQGLADVANEHGLLVISDEIYERLWYDGSPATMVGRCESVLLLNGFSKMGAMTGWRVGFAAGPEDIIQAMNTLQQYSFVCAPSFAQHAAIIAFQVDHSKKVDAYKHKRDIIYDGLKEKFNVVRPGGAFYIFPEAPGGDGGEFVKRAIDSNVLTIPGDVFSEFDSHFRISFAAPDETLREGVEILNRLAG